MASLVKPCRSAARYFKLNLRPWLFVAPKCAERSNSSEASNHDVFGQLAKEIQEKNITKQERMHRFPPNGRKLQQHRKKEWEEKFGTLSPSSKTEVVEPTADVHFDTWNDISECCEEMKTLVKKGQISDALELLDTVCQSETIRPNAFLYNILIGACGRTGDTKLAFKLYRKIKERGLAPDASTYTSLFNACANSPSRQEGHRQATYLYNKLRSEEWVPNTTNYLAMLKAFGRCNDLPTTFCIVDEMAASSHLFDARVLDSLLSACLSDKQSGFSRALQVWRRFRQMRIQPSLHSYHLLLRVLKDCGPGSVSLTSGHTYLGTLTRAIPDSQTTAVVVAADVETPESRLSAVGGVEAFFANLANDNLRPDVLTFTNMLLLLPDSTDAESSLLATMKEHGLKPDTALFNALIKRRNFRGDYLAALDVLSQMQVESVVPDLVTFGVLALGCNTKRHAQHLLRDMHMAGFRPNIHIFGALIKNACWNNNWSYACEVLAQMKEEQVLPNDRILKRIEKSIAIAKENLVLLEKGQKVPTIFMKFSKPEIVEQFRLFLIVYKGWLQVMNVSPECYEQRTY